MKKTKKNNYTRSPFCFLTILLIPILAVSYSVLATHVSGENVSGSIIIANFDLPVDPGSSTFMSRVVNDAINANASAIVIEMNTPGGLLSDMTAIISSITEANQSGIPTYTYVVSNGLGASAGSYIAMATNKILMGSGSAIGPSTPIVVGGSSLEQNHTQAAMLKLMVSLAEKWNRNSTAAYDMVQNDVAFSANEALKYHLIDGLANSLNDAIDELGLSGKQQVILNEDLYEEFISALSNPILDGILMLLGVLAIVLDVYHPTIVLTILGGTAIVAGLVGASVINASWLGFFIIAVAAFLIVLELKLGHGLAMMAGVVLGAFGILYLANGLTYSPSPITSVTDLELFLVAVGGIVAGLYVRWVLGPMKRRSKLTGPEALVGQIGEAVTDLKPNGEVRVGGIVWRAESVSGDISKGAPVRVKSLKGLVVVVERV